MRRRRTGRAAAALVAAAVAVVAAAVAGCGGAGGDEERSQPSLTVPSTSATTATTAPPEPDPDPERVEAEAPPGEPRPDIDVNVTYPSDFTPDQIAVVEAYRGYVHAYLAAADPVDPHHPLIDRFATAERAQGIRSALERLRADRLVARMRDNGRSVHAVLSVQINGSVALLRDCSIDDGLLVSVVDGQIVDDDVVTREGEFTLTRVAGSWKVSGTQPRIVSEQPGVTGCAEQLS